MAHEKEFPGDMSFIDGQGHEVHPSRKDYDSKKPGNVGKAYAFFDCDASSEQIEESMPCTRHDARTPKDLELLLHEGTSGLQPDEMLAKQIQYLRDNRVMSSERLKQGHEEEKRSLASMKYILEAHYKGSSNKATANELDAVMNNVFRFNKDQGLFRGAVIYEENNKYFFRD